MNHKQAEEEEEVARTGRAVESETSRPEKRQKRPA